MENWNSHSHPMYADRWIASEAQICGWNSGSDACPLLSRLRDLGSGERRELPHRGPGQSPGRKQILAYFEGNRTLLFVSMTESVGQFALVSHTPNSGRLVAVPRDLRASINIGCVNAVVAQSAEYVWMDQTPRQFLLMAAGEEFSRVKRRGATLQWPGACIVHCWRCSCDEWAYFDCFRCGFLDACTGWPKNGTVIWYALT